jgi:hypothetical protein
VDFSAIWGRVVLAASALRCAKTSISFELFEVPYVAVTVLLVLPFLEVSASSDPMFPAGSIFLPEAAGCGTEGTKISFPQGLD